MKKKTIYLLIGKKGSGKSHIAGLMDEYFDVHFLRVENWVKSLKGTRNITDESYIREVFEVIEAGVRSNLIVNDKIVFESTGISTYFNTMFNNLKRDFKIITIKIDAEDVLCAKRVKSRDQSIHIKVSDAQLKKINQEVNVKNLQTDFTLSNNDKNKVELLEELKLIINLE